MLVQTRATKSTSLISKSLPICHSFIGNTLFFNKIVLNQIFVYGIIRRLIDLPCVKDEEGEVTPEIIISFEEDAKARLYMWQEEYARLCDTEHNEVLVGVYCKLEIYIIRFCLIIQLVRWYNTPHKLIFLFSSEFDFYLFTCSQI